ncbi:MAG: DNA methyltransferase, partial [Planktothrix sp.]
MINALEQQFFSYEHIAGEIPCNLESEKFITVQRKPPLKIYSLGFQPAKFIPEIPRWFLKKYTSPSFTVLDPFCGSGTTLLEAIQQQISGYWVDYHPLSRLICQVKTTVFSPLDVLEATTQIIEKASTQKFASSTINFANKDFWFQQPVQEGLEILREQILLAESSIQPLLWLAFASTVRKTSNMNDGMILAARRPHIEKIPDRSRLDVFQYFQHYVKQSIEAFVEWNPFLKRFEAQIQQLSSQDARQLPEPLKVDAIITSPPYINAIDYVWASKFELHWLGLVSHDQERLNLYSKEIGTERIPKQECKELGKTGYSHLDQLIED